MNILAIGHNTTNIPADLLDWLTKAELKAGVNCKGYWIIQSTCGPYIPNPNGDQDICNLAELLHDAISRGFDQLMITKNQK